MHQRSPLKQCLRRHILRTAAWNRDDEAWLTARSKDTASLGLVLEGLHGLLLLSLLLLESQIGLVKLLGGLLGCLQRLLLAA